MAAKKLVLAYSGGLDTSVAIRWLKDLGWDVIASRSFFSPRSTVNAITSQPRSFNQRIATDVSSPPEYARTSVAAMGEKFPQRPARTRLPQHSDDRVVARHRAGDAG